MLSERAAQWKAANRQAALASEHRRRARKLGARNEPIDVAEVWSRDGGCCWICGVAVDPNAAPTDPMRRSLDHVIPLAAGGWHAMDNVALSHLRCNIKKRAKVPDRLPAWHPGGGGLDALVASAS